MVAAADGAALPLSHLIPGTRATETRDAGAGGEARGAGTRRSLLLFSPPHELFLIRLFVVAHLPSSTLEAWRPVARPLSRGNPCLIAAAAHGMEAVKNVEREIDRVITKFTALNEHANQTLSDLLTQLSSLRKELLSDGTVTSPPHTLASDPTFPLFPVPQLQVSSLCRRRCYARCVT